MEKISLETKRNFDLEDRLIEFSVMAIGIVESLPETRTCSHLGGQLDPEHPLPSIMAKRKALNHAKTLCTKSKSSSKNYGNQGFV